MERLTLYRYHTPLDLSKGAISWRDLLRLAGRAAGAAGAHALLYAAGEARWCRLDTQGGLTPPPTDAERVFELRVFDGQREWRWLREGDAGRGALVAESPQSLPGDWVAMDCPPDGVHRRHHRLLLWGTASDPVSHDAHGFSLLATPRIGSLALPAQPRPGGSLALTVFEYFLPDEHGNPDLLDERLGHLQPASVTA